MFAVEVYAVVRRFVFVEGHSRREAARVFGLSRETVLKMCRFSLPPGYTRTLPISKPKLGALLPVIDAILEADRSAPAKQRHTAKRIFERLRDEHGFAGGYTVVKDHVRIGRARGRETFVPLAHPPGHAQVDFGEAAGVIGGVRQKIHFFCMDLPQSDANAMLAECCRGRQGDHAGRHAETIGERLEADLAVLRALPTVPLEPCEKRAGRVSSTSLVRYRGNDYSVPAAYGFRDVVVKGFVDQVVILCGGAVVARHKRAYGAGEFVADPLHYLALIETKPNALDQAAALQGWDLPEVFQHLRHLLEARMGNRGKREFIQVLRLMEAMSQTIVTAAVTEAIRLGAIGFDAVKLIALARLERRPARLDLAAYPHLPRPAVRTTSAADYTALVRPVAA